MTKMNRKPGHPYRKMGAPCLCNSWGHYHDGETCGKPVYGRTRAGNMKKVCDDCSHYAYLHRHALDLAPPPIDALAREPNVAPRQPASPQPERSIPARYIPPPPTPAKPARPPGYRTDRPGTRPDDDDIATVKF
jgi:hypothetical protein